MKLSVIALLASSAAAFPFASQLDTEAVAFFDEQARVIKLGPEEFRIVSEDDKLDLKRDNIGFIDVTGTLSVKEAILQGLVGKSTKSGWLHKITNFGAKQIEQMAKPLPVYQYPTEPQHVEKVTNLFESINMTRPYEDLAKFTSFYTRYYKSQTGLDSANWLYHRIAHILEPGAKALHPSVTKVSHEGWDQFSIVVSMPGSDSSDKVVIGSHQDSVNLLLPSLRAPGADDDGLGTVTTLEALRIIVDAAVVHGFKPKNTLEFHFYSAEEAGLLGSHDVFSRYAEANETVVGMLQQDMTGYTATTILKGIEPHFGLITDYTSQRLNSFIKTLIDKYNDIPYHETSCGYACSDHASALEYGYPSSFLIESEMSLTSKLIHSPLDTLDRLDFEHIREHIKLTVAFAYELSMAENLH